MLSSGRITLFCLTSLLIAACASDQSSIKHTFWPDGTPKEEWHEKTASDGKTVKHGPCRSWNEDGLLVEEGQYLMSQPSGRWTTWYGTEPNSKHTEGEYLNGEMDGVWYFWMPSSHDLHAMHSIDSTDDSSHAGMIDSTMTDHSSHAGMIDSTRATGPKPERKPHKREEYRSGQAHGSFISWYHSGQTADSMGYANGQLEGEYVIYHENGTKATEAFFIKGVRQGPQTYWDESGNPLRTVE